MKTCFFFCYGIHSDLYSKADKYFLSEPCGCLSDDDDFADASSHYTLHWCSSAELISWTGVQFPFKVKVFSGAIAAVRIKTGGSNVRFIFAFIGEMWCYRMIIAPWGQLGLIHLKNKKKTCTNSRALLPLNCLTSPNSWYIVWNLDLTGPV